MDRIWDDILSEQDRAVIHAAGYDRLGAASWDSRKLGSAPALVLIDMQVHQLGRDVPILEAVAEFRTAMGERGWGAVPAIQRLLTAVRAAGHPVLHTRVIPRGYDPADPDIQIIDAVKPEPGEVVVDKWHSSAFYGTDLVTRLVRQGVDTVIVAGNSTSGCVRATAVDARQHGFKPLVPVECVFDRLEVSHKVGLLDLWMKYAAVLPVDVLHYLAELDKQAVAGDTVRSTDGRASGRTAG